MQSHHFSIIVENTPKEASAARRTLCSFLEESAVESSTQRDLEIAVGEALANAAEHARDRSQPIRLDADVRPDAVEVTIRNDGPGFAIHNLVFPNPLASSSSRGFGVFLMHSTVNTFELEDGGRTVRLVSRRAH